MWQLQLGRTVGVLALGMAMACSADASSTGDSTTEGNDGSGTMAVDTDAQPTDGGSGSSGEPACEEPDAQVLWSEDGQVMEPMAIADGNALGVDVARSWSAGQGTLTLEFSTECDGPIHLWALVWDMMGGEMDNADSLYMTVDDQDEFEWLYGCNTPGSSEGLWSWIAVDVWTEEACLHDPLTLELEAGDHTIVVRNRENGMGINVAAIAGVVWSHDPATDPSQFLTPPEPESGR